jgi:hypothetical protein
MRRTLLYLVCVMLLLLTSAVSGQGEGALRLTNFDFVLEAEAYPLFVDAGWSGERGRGVVDIREMRVLPNVVSGRLREEDVSARMMIIYTLRRDQVWRDGTSITAYDVLYSFLLSGFVFTEYLSPGGMIVNASRPICCAAVLNPNTFVLFTPGGEDDDFQALANFPIAPVEVYDSAFLDIMRATFAGRTLDDPQSLFEAALAMSNSFDFSVPDLYDPEMLALTPRFEFPDSDGTLEIRLLAGELPVVVTTIDSSDPGARVDDFLAGRYDLLINPPFERRADLRRLADTRIVEPIGRTWYGLAINPLDADTRVRVEGEPIPPSPYLSDPRVRQAIALAIDVDALGEAATSGHFQPFGTLRDWRELAQRDQRGEPPPDRAPFDPLAARALLEEAGWKDWDRDGIRECRGCGTATDGARMSLLLLYEQFNDVLPKQRIMSRLLTEQLRRVGIEIVGLGSDMFEIAAELADARHMLALVRFTERDPVAFNVVRAFPQDDAFIYLFSERDLYAARTWVTGFDPRSGDPLQNIESWRLAR